MDSLIFFVAVCLIGLLVAPWVGLLIYTRKIEKRRRQDAEKYEEAAAALTARIHALESSLNYARQQPGMPWATPAETAHSVAKAAEPKPAAPRSKPTPATPVPASGTPTSVIPAISEGARAPQAPGSLPKPREATEIPLAPVETQRVHPPLAAAASTTFAPPKPAAPAPGHSPAAQKKTVDKRSFLTGASDSTPQASANSASHAASVPLAGMVKPPQASSTLRAKEGDFTGTPAQTQAPQKTKKASISLEESLATNWFPKVAVTLIVVGVAFALRAFWGNIGPGGRVAILYTAALGTLGGGVFLEAKERYRKVGRALIGGGWAILFVMAYAINHVQAVRVLPSEVVDLFLMVATAGVMVWHTLKYNSQTVTGIAFLLGFASVTLNPDPPYSLIAAAILVGGLTVIVLRRQWFELEVCGILASYLNHFYWLYTVINPMPERRLFPQYKSSVFLMILYWTIFRVSYLARKVSSQEQESLSTFAALVNALGFLAVMKYQSFHPEWAFYALLTMGAVEFTLGQLPVSHRRQAPFRVLSSLGATLMVIAVPFKFAGSHSLELLWLAGAEVFLLAGVFTRERLFRQFGGLISLLVAIYLLFWPPNGVIYLAQKIVDGDPHQDANLSIALAVTAGLLYLNSHVIARIWQALFDHEAEEQTITALSFAASLFAVGSVYAAVSTHAVAIVLAVLVTALAWTGKRFGLWQLGYQAHWIALVAVADVSISAIHLDASSHSIPERLITFGLVAALLYLSSNFVRLNLPAQERAEVPVVLYRWAATGLIALAIWMQISFASVRRDWLIAVLWTALALLLCGVTQFLKRSEFKWQAFTLVLMSFCCALALNFDFSEQFHGLSYRLISVTLVACGIYLLARWAPVAQARPAYSWAGTILLGYLAYRETQEHYELWTAVLWAALAAVLGLAARFWKDRAVLWQTHLLSAVATAWTIGIVFLGDSQYHGTRLELISVLITAALLYGLTWITNIKGVIESDSIWQAYSWAGSLLLTWLAWYQLDPINVSLAWGLFALVVFELGYGASSSYLRAQAYVALACSFAHLFYSNFNTPMAVSGFDPHILLIALLVPIYFWIYWRLHEKKVSRGTESGTPSALASEGVAVEYSLACIGTATIAALARFELPPEAVVVGYAAIVVALLTTAWWARLQVFVYQALIMTGVVAFRISMHNFYNLRGSFVSALAPALWAIGLLAASIPIAFRVRSKDEQDAASLNWITFLVRRPEQPLFFAAVVLMAVLLFIKLSDIVTLAWGIEGVAVFLLALVARERSFRLTGFALVVICVAKIACWDAWRMSDLRARYLTFIGVGVVILVVSYLYARYKEALREYL